MMALNIASMPETYSSPFWTTHLNQFGDLFYVAKVGDKVVGYIMCRQEQVGYVRMGLVISVAVDKAYQKQGIGEALMKDAHYAMRMRRIPMAGLQVRKSNEAAIQMYKKLGYKVNMTIPHYYNHPDEEGYLMTYVL
jgi:ribosomal-protein-alanine N-acetyltransferase